MNNYDRVYNIIKGSLPDQDTIKAIVDLLRQKDIKIRQDDGELRQVNISLPKSISDAIVIGLRYVKKDDSQTEDHFLIRKSNNEIKKYYKGTLEKDLKEYNNTHKDQVILNQESYFYLENGIPSTDVSTYTFNQ